ncbi:DUF1318 domain-containing protein [Geobacter sp. SVR]|uniref:DUF1318 domain-containing protein n=1 Tax=Geobacter sp. SVR TaxID=2495594 RepID=UPI00143EFBD2|nr:DUF1318 domain-containing protein [Geobacter sp. SVR]BCS52715.1 lipoprotein [Geobacter sp. SVR]GCF86789.1 lipoprotein [Geobacter sp. SVR]
MKTRLMKWLVVWLCGLFAACAVITVNVYFPEKAAKEAYKSLDDMLLKEGSAKPRAGENQTGHEQAAPAPKPQSGLFRELGSFSLVSVASAAESEADTLAIEMADMPEVNKAYAEMSQRLPRLTALFDSGAVGLTNQGLVTVRDKSKLSAADEGMIAAENQSRKTLVGSMAKAILKLGKQKESKGALDQVMGKAAATYAETRRDAARPGWWMQLQNGRWVQK